MATNLFGWKNRAETATLGTSTPMQTAWPYTYAVSRRLRQAAKGKASARRQASLTADLGSTYVQQPVRLATLTDHVLGTNGRYRIQASNLPLLEDPALLLDFLATETDGRPWPNTLDSRITFSRASGGMFWRDGVLFGAELVTRTATALTTSVTTWTVAAGGKWQAGDLVYVLPQDGTANVSLTATVQSYGGTTLSLESVTAGSDTTTTKTDFRIVYRGPRLDSHPLTKRRLGLLIEGSGTNLRTYSEQFDNAAYTATRARVMPNVEAAPNGGATADKLIEDGAGSSTHQLSSTVSLTTGTAYTLSVFVKAAGRHRFSLAWDASGAYSTAQRATFNLQSGAVTTNSGSPTTRIERLPSGWWRVAITATTTSTATGTAVFYLDDGSTTSYDGDSRSGVFLWGAQVDASSFPTSYIPTVGASVSRSADTATISGSSFTSWFVSGPGTVLARFRQPYSFSSNRAVLSIDDGTAANRFILLTEGSPDKVRWFVDSGGTTVANVNAGEILLGGSNAQAATLAANDFSMSVNGMTTVSDTAGALPSGLSQLQIGVSAAIANWHGWMEGLAYFARRLPNARLEAWSRRGPTINSDFASCSVDLPLEYTFSRATGATYVDALGRIQGAYPSITQPIVPQTTREERVRNGGFDSDSLWTKGTGWTIGSGVATKSAGTGSNLAQTIPTVPGQVYRLRTLITRSAGTVVVDAGGTDLQTVSADTTVSTTFTASATTTAITFEADSSFAGTVDNVSVTLDTGLQLPVGAGLDIKVGQLMRIVPQDGTANTYMLGKVVAYSGAIVTVDVVEAAAPELISNGHFTSATTGWTALLSATLSVSSNRLRVTNTTTAFGGAFQGLSLTSGGRYRLIVEGDRDTSTAKVYVNVGNSGGGSSNLASTNSTTDDLVPMFLEWTDAGGTTSISVQIDNGSSSAHGDFDNISVKRAHTNWVVALAGPRFAHAPSTYSALGLLVEESRTNVMTVSEDTSTDALDTGWKRNNITRTSAGHAGPFGRASATLFTATGSSATHYVQARRSTIASPFRSAASIFVKAGNATKVRVRCVADTLTHGGYADFNLTTGALITSAAVSSGSVVATLIEAYAGGWYRVGVAVDHTSASNGLQIIAECYILDSTGAATYTPASTAESLYMTGMQIEAGSFVTSYIPTLGVSRSRAADVCTIEGDNFTARYRQDEGTIYVSGFRSSAVVSGATHNLIELDNGTTAERIGVYTNSTQNYRAFVTDGSVSQVDTILGTLVPSATNRVAVAYKVNDVAGSLDGAAVATDTSATMPTATRVDIGRNVAASGYWSAPISRLIYWPERRTNAELVAMTTSGADLSDYTLPGDLSDAYAGAFDSGKVAAWETGQTRAKIEELLSAAVTYRYWRVDQMDLAGADADPGTADDAVTLEWPYLGLWNVWQPAHNRSPGSSRERVSRTEVIESLSGAEEFDSRPGHAARQILFRYLTLADLAIAEAMMEYADIHTPIYFMPDPAATGVDRDKAKLGRLERLSSIEEAYYDGGATGFRVKEWIA